MQDFIDTATQALYAFDDDVQVSNANGVYSFATAAGVPLKLPATLQPHTVPAPTSAQVATQALVQSAMLMLSTGIAVVSTGTPALNGTYAVDQLSQMDVIAIETSLNAGKGFPGGATTFGYQDVTGALHSFSEANFTDFAAAVRDFVYACKSVIAGQSTTLPPATAMIA